MIDRATRLKWRRRFKRSKKQFEGISQQAEDHLDKHFFYRLGRLVNVRRFILSWLLLVVLLIGITFYQLYGLSPYYQRLEPTPGGIFQEGIVGTYSTSNPLFATNPVDETVSSLIFPGLLKYNQKDQLVGALAKSWAVNSSGNQYTVVLRKNLKWQDGQPLTAADVVFTYNTIQNPNTESPLFNSWQDVKVSALNSTTVQFTLNNALVSFPYSLTNGIIPEHLLANIAPSELRSADFDTTNPVGSGPFKMQEIDVTGDTPATYQQKIGLIANPLYYAGQPKLQQFIINTYNSQSAMISGFQKGNIDSMVGLESLPASLTNNSSIYSYNIPLTSQVMVFFRTSQAILSDNKVRQALVQATNVGTVVQKLNHQVLPSKSPLLPFQLGYDPAILQLSYNPGQANQLLSQDGWVMGKDGVRSKNNQPLSFNLYTQDDPQYLTVADNLAQQWKKVGVSLDVIAQQPNDLDNTITNHSYDSLLYGISNGVDPDEFVYWDSSQAQPNSVPGLNLSQYKSTVADEALEGARIVSDPPIRAAKYHVFLQTWQSDAPAVALYQQRLLYVSRIKIFNFDPVMVNVPTDRFSNVQNWMIRETKRDII